MRIDPLARAALAAVFLALQTAAPSLAVKPAKHPAPPAAYAPPRIVTPLLGICDATGVLDVLGDLSDADKTKKRNQIALLQGRIVDCSHKIAAMRASTAPTATPYWTSAVPAPSAMPTAAAVCADPPPATTDSNRFALFEILQRCSAYVASATGSASPAPTSTALPSVASRPTFYVFATGAVDPTTATVLIRSVVARLTRAEARATHAREPSGAPDALPPIVVSGRADWTATDGFVSQCQLDPNTRGALVISTSMPELYRDNYLLLVANFTQVSAAVEVLGCGADDHNEAASPLSLYSEQAISGKAHQDTLTLGIFSSIAAFLATNKTKTTVSNAGGSTTITQTASSSPVLTGSVLSYFEGQNLDVPAQNASVQMNVAGRRFADGAMARLHSLCRQPEILRLAEQGNPHAVPQPPPERRTLAYEAAFDYVDDCATFADFDPQP